MKDAFWRRQWAKRMARQAARGRRVPWGVIIGVLLATIALPAVLDVLLARVCPGFLTDLQVAVIALYTLTSLMIIWESLAAWRLPARPGAVDEGALPACTAIVAAYLPNEQDIILETILHMLGTLEVAEDRLQVVLAYNTPESLPIEEALRDLARHDSRFCLLRVEGSRSKAQNVNAALEVATGEIVAVYDADHLPEPACFRKAWRWLSHGYHVVQGRCVIRNHAENWLTRTIAVEFDGIYAVSHQGRSNLSKTAIFGGSNGYWRRDALCAAGLDPAMLTEDIDSSVRTLLAGRRLVHDRDIVSYELAPTQASHWFFQRKRWAQGWLEVTLKYLGALLRSRRLSGEQKLIWFYLLGWREAYPLLGMQFFPLVIAAWWLGRPLHWFGTPLQVVTSTLNLGVGLFQAWVTYRLGFDEGRRSLGRWYLLYGLFALAYTAIKSTVTLVAQWGHLQRDRAWVTTPRTVTTIVGTCESADEPTRPAQEPLLATASPASQSNSA